MKFFTIKGSISINNTKLPLPIHIQYNKLCDAAKNRDRTYDTDSEPFNIP
ncbi:hypothetical protein [Chryseobacterium sp. GVT01B]|nr:hypothetical protein [Chryseobacterium sp. GVT01B]